MLDLNQLIQQRRTLKKYQGNVTSGTVAPNISTSSYEIEKNLSPENRPMGTPAGAGIITQENPTDNLDKIVQGGELGEVTVSEYSESLEDRNNRYNQIYRDYIETGTLPEGFVPYGELEFGYDGGPYVNYSDDYASVWRTDENTRERYDMVDVPMNEWLFGVVESQTVIDERNREKNIANQPTWDGNPDTKEQWESDINAYWEKIHDEEYNKKDGWYKDPTSGDWKLVPYMDAIEAYDASLVDAYQGEEEALISAGLMTDPNAPSKERAGILGENTRDALQAATVALVADDATLIGVANDWLIPLTAGALAIDAASKVDWAQTWQSITSTGAYANASPQSQGRIKEIYDGIRAHTLSEGVWETVNGVQGLYVPTAAGEIFVSRDYVENARTSAYGGQQLDMDFEGKGTQLELPLSQQATMSGGEGGGPDPDKNPNRFKRWLNRAKGYGKNAVDKISKTRTKLKELNPFSKTSMQNKKGTPWGDATTLQKAYKVIQLNQGNTWVGRWATRLFWGAAADEAHVLAHPDRKYGLIRGMFYDEAQEIFDENMGELTLQQKYFEIIDTNKNNPEGMAEDLTTFVKENYSKDSVFFESFKHMVPYDSIVEFESGYEGYGTDSTISKDNYKKGGLVHTASNQIRQFKEGGVMSRIRSYQGDHWTGAVGLPAGYEGVESPYPSITAPDDTYSEMIDWGGFTQPGQSELNKYGFQNYDDWRGFMKTVPGFDQYDWNNITHWGKQHQGAWDWTTSNRREEQEFEIDDDYVVPNPNQTGPTCPDGFSPDGKGGCIPNTDQTNIQNRKQLTDQEILELQNQSKSQMFKDVGGRLLAGAASIVPAWFAWNQANKMEGEVDEFSDIPDIKSPQVNIKAPINEVNMQIEDLDSQMNMVVEKLKSSGASASAILAAEKQRRTEKSKLTAKKEDLLLKADAESQRLTAGYAMDAAKQNQVKNIKMKLEEMDFRTATKKAKIDILQNLTNTVTGIILDERKMYSDKNIAAVVTSALTAGTGLAHRQRMVEMMINMGFSTEQIKSAQGGDQLLEGTGF